MDGILANKWRCTEVCWSLSCSLKWTSFGTLIAGSNVNLLLWNCVAGNLQLSTQFQSKQKTDYCLQDWSCQFIILLLLQLFMLYVASVNFWFSCCCSTLSCMLLSRTRSTLLWISCTLLLILDVGLDLHAFCFLFVCLWAVHKIHFMHSVNTKIQEPKGWLLVLQTPARAA
jgi:hypothetical protein